MRRALVAAALVLGFALSAAAGSFTPAMTTLRAALDARLQALSGATDSVSKAHAKALREALKSIDKKTTSTLAADVSLALSVIKTIEKGIAPNDDDGNIALAALVTDVENERAGLDDDLASLPDSAGKTKLNATLAQFDSHMSRASLPVSSVASGVFRCTALKLAMAKLTAAGKALDKLLNACGPGVVDTFTDTVDDVDTTPPLNEAHIDKSRTVTTVSGFSQTSGGLLDTIVSFTLYSGYFNGTGTYPVQHTLTGANFAYAVADYRRDISAASLSTAWNTDSVTGTLDLASYNPTKKRIAGKFDVTFTIHFLSDPGAKLTRHVVGRFRICDMKQQ